MAVDITLDHLRRQVVIDPHQQSAVVVARRPERACIEAAKMVGSSVIKTRQLRVRRVITDLTLQQAVLVRQPDARAHGDNKAPALAQREAAHLFMEG